MLTKTLTFSATALAVALALSACGGGGGGSSVSAGSTTAGTITGFGSVFVNGVEFETAGASISVDKANATESNLKVGMMVTVQGQVNPDGSTGTATSIEYSDELEGQVVSNGIVAPSTTGVIDIMGQQITITDTTVFESDVTGITTIDQIVAGNIVEVSGTVTGLGSIEATRIEVTAATLSDHLADHDSIEMKGVISALDTNTLTFTLGDMVVDYSGIPQGEQAALADGLYVEVESVDGIVSGQLIASSISLEDDGEQGYQGEDGEDMDVKGTISRDFDGSSFDVDGTTVIVDSATHLEEGLSTADLITGAVVEVEGSFNATGELVASSIEGHADADQEIHGTVAVVTLDGVNSGTISLDDADNTVIQITNDTIMVDDREDGTLPDEMFNLSKLASGDSIEVEVYMDSSNNLVAVKLERDNPETIQ